MFLDYMTYTRGSSQDYDRYASVSGDQGWGWIKMAPYILKVGRTGLIPDLTDFCG